MGQSQLIALSPQRCEAGPTAPAFIPGLIESLQEEMDASSWVLEVFRMVGLEKTCEFEASRMTQKGQKHIF